MLENGWNNLKSKYILQLIFEALVAQRMVVPFQLSVLAAEV